MTYTQRRKFKAMPRWEKAYALRKSGLKFREIADELNTSIRVAFRCVVNYESHLLANRACVSSRLTNQELRA